MVIRNGRWCAYSRGDPPQYRYCHQGRPDRLCRSRCKAYHCKATRVIDAGDRYLVPGLLDGHMHIESGMLTVTEFVRGVIPHGTTGMFVDPHEIANVFGIKGVSLMVNEAMAQPIHVWVQMPSCVPSAPGLETPGANIGPAEVAEAMTWDGIIGLGEMMNFPGVFLSDEKMHAEMAETRGAGKCDRRALRLTGFRIALPRLRGWRSGGRSRGDAAGRCRGSRPARDEAHAPIWIGWHDVAAQVRRSRSWVWIHAISSCVPTIRIQRRSWKKGT